ncbi:hypothetical protein OL239_12735 [Arthrobacter sp. ATA002]|nr:hypothetical protein [Arthrobacter sp. ATA002]WAP50848.1 hypothetical protein OL239_12735 [Arthrobacter sp. ATA002]
MNRASAAVARKLGLTATGQVDADGEERGDNRTAAPGARQQPQQST